MSQNSGPNKHGRSPRTKRKSRSKKKKRAALKCGAARKAKRRNSRDSRTDLLTSRLDPSWKPKPFQQFRSFKPEFNT